MCLVDLLQEVNHVLFFVQQQIACIDFTLVFGVFIFTVLMLFLLAVFFGLFTFLPVSTFTDVFALLNALQ